MNKGEKWMADF